MRRGGGPRAGRGTVAVAMSGGVDSSAAAAILAAKGYRVFGLTLLLFDLPISGRKSCVEARAAARRLGIPHKIVDARSEFRRLVIRPFLKDYASGRTPNPCVLCNENVKFGLLFRRARELGAEFLATGHYARLSKVGGRVRLFEARDKERDQSYFLYRVPAGILRHVLFPLGAMNKDSARRLARRAGVCTARGRESVEACFAGGEDMGRFLSKRIRPAPGPILDGKGKVLGRHEGIHNFTIGQRRGLRIAAGRRLYVKALDHKRRAVIAGSEESLRSSRCEVEDVCFVDGRWPKGRATVKIRSRHPGAAARIVRIGAGRARVLFLRPQRAVAPGQAAVFYRRGEVLGGGTIRNGSASD